MTTRQFRSGYTTMILNNLTGARTASTNCEEDKSVALLYDVHDLIEKNISNAKNATQNITDSHVDDPYGDVLYDPEFSERDCNFYEEMSLTHASSVICSKIVDRCCCDNCQSNLQTDSEFVGNKSNLFDLNYPSTEFIEMFKKIFEFSTNMIPSVCFERNIKEIVIKEVKQRLEEEARTNEHCKLNLIGCVEHNEEILNKTVEFTVSYCINIFCKNINSLLTGKIKDLPKNYNDVQHLAIQFVLKKKRIGKHSDIFKTKS